MMKVSPLPVLLFAWFVLGISTVEAQQRLTPEPAPRARFLVEPTVEGVIKIGTPQVYSRQLVFRDRAEEIQYLSERLKKAKDFPTTFQGIVDSRFYKALGLQMALAVDPLTGRVADQGKINQALNLEQQVQVSELENEIKVLDALRRKAEAQKLLDEAKKPVVPPKEGEEEDDDAPPPNPILPSPAVDDKARTDIAALQTQIDALKNAGPATPAAEDNRVKPGTGTDAPSVLKDGGAAAKTTEASLTPIENEKAVLEVRRFLQNERRRLSFDDMHDAAGSVAVDLGMLVTMIPPKGKDAYAVVEAFVEDVAVENCADYQRIVQTWSDHLLTAMQLEKEFLEERMAANALPFGEKYFQLAVQELQRGALEQDLLAEAQQAAKAEAAKAEAERKAREAAAAREAAELSEKLKKAALEKAQQDEAAAKANRNKADEARKPKGGVQFAPGVLQTLEAQFSQALEIEKKAGLDAKAANQEYVNAAGALGSAEVLASMAEKKQAAVEKEVLESQTRMLDLQSRELQTQSSFSAVNLYAQKLQDTQVAVDRAVVAAGGGEGAPPYVPTAMGGSTAPASELTLLDQLILTLIPIQEQKDEKAKGDIQYARLMRKYRERLLNSYLRLYFGDCLRGVDLGKGMGGGDFLSLVSKKDVMQCAARTYLQQLSSDASRSRVRVLAVDPADQGQNISNVGATQSISDIVLSLSAMMPNGISGKGRMDSYRDSQLYLQSANRKPIAVGFVNGDVKDPSFGWVLGPRFEVALKRRWYQLGMGEPRATPIFTHEPTQHQVQVSIGMAAWTPELRLKLNTRWLDKKTGLPATPLQSSYTVPVRMTPDFTAMTEGMLDLIHGKRRPPRILIGARGEKFILSSQGDDHKLVLLGKDMWRSPMVYLDSLPATTVDVMPGLVGVVATFKGALPLKKAGKTDHDVTITTTDGFDVIYNRVESPKAPSPPAPNPGQAPSIRLGLQQPVIKHPFNDNGELVIPLTLLENPFPMLPPQSLLSAKCFPLGLYDRMVDARPQTGMNNTLTLVVGKAAEPVLKSVPGLELTSPSGKPASALMSFTVTMQVMNPQAGVPEARDVVTGNRQVLLVDPKRCLFTAQEGLKFTLGDVEQELRLLFPDQVLADHFKLAYPDLVTAAQAGTVKLELVDADAVTRVYATLAMKGPATDVAQGLYFRVPPRTDAAFFNGLTLDPTKDTTRTKSFVLRLSYGSTYEKVSKTVTLEVPLKPAS